MLQAQLSQDLQRTAREKLEVQNQLAVVRGEQEQLQVRLLGCHLPTPAVPPAQPAPHRIHHFNSPAAYLSQASASSSISLLVRLLTPPKHWPSPLLQATMEQLNKEKWELAAVNNDLQQRLQQTLTLAHMQVRVAAGGGSVGGVEYCLHGDWRIGHL